FAFGCAERAVVELDLLFEPLAAASPEPDGERVLKHLATTRPMRHPIHLLKKRALDCHGNLGFWHDLTCRPTFHPTTVQAGRSAASEAQPWRASPTEDINSRQSEEPDRQRTVRRKEGGIEARQVLRPHDPVLVDDQRQAPRPADPIRRPE